MTEFDQSLIRSGAFCIWILGHLYFYLWVKFNQLDRQARFNAYLDDSAQYYDLPWTLFTKTVTQDEVKQMFDGRKDVDLQIRCETCPTLIDGQIVAAVINEAAKNNHPKRRKYRDNK